MISNTAYFILIVCCAVILLDAATNYRQKIPLRQRPEMLTFWGGLFLMGNRFMVNLGKAIAVILFLIFLTLIK